MIIYGKNVIKEAILNQRQIYKLYIDEKMTDYKFLEFLKKYGLTPLKVSKGELNKLTDNAVHNGIVADAKAYDYVELETVLTKGERQVFLMLDEIHDPHNLGAILRSVEATNISGVILSKKHQVPLTGVVAKTSSGAIEHVNLILVSNLYQTILKLKEEGFLIVGTDVAGTKSYKELPKDQPLVIIMGNEGEGLRPLIKKGCDLLVTIPMKGKVNSLNVSVATALLLYEAI